MENKEFISNYIFEINKKLPYVSFRGFVQANNKYIEKIDLKEFYSIYCNILKYQINKYGGSLGCYATLEPKRNKKVWRKNR